MWVLRLQPGAQLTLPPTNHAETIRTLYSLRGSLTIEGETLEQEGAVLRSTEALDISAGDEGAFALILQGRPIGAPVYQRGPFVANSREELIEAFTPTSVASSAHGDMKPMLQLRLLKRGGLPATPMARSVARPTNWDPGGLHL